MGSIVMVAAPYCYGPTSKLMSVAEELAPRHTLTYVGAEPGLALASTGNFAQVLPVRDRDVWEADCLKLLKSADLLVSFLDYRALLIAQTHGIPSIFFDTLLWTRPELPPYTSRAQTYIAQRFLDEASAVLTPLNLRWVGPVIPRQLEKTASEQLHLSRQRNVLVHFGGLKSPATRSGADLDYAGWILDILHKAISKEVFFTVCLPQYMRQTSSDLQSRAPGARLQFSGFSDFHQQLLQCDAFITVPGLEAVLEAMSLGKAIIFLPPHNATQLRQMAVYRAHEVGFGYLDVEHVCGFTEPDVSFNDVTAQLQRSNSSKSKDSSVTDALAARLNRYLSLEVAASPRVDEYRNRNKHLFQALGQRGRQTTATIIEEHL